LFATDGVRAGEKNCVVVFLVLIFLAIVFLLLALLVKALKFLLFVAVVVLVVGVVRGWTARRDRA